MSDFYVLFIPPVHSDEAAHRAEAVAQARRGWGERAYQVADISRAGRFLVVRLEAA